MQSISLQWGGAIFGLVGATLLATNSRFSRWGWFFFLFANCLYIFWAIRIDAHGLLLQQVGFTMTSLLGIFRTRSIQSQS